MAVVISSRSSERTRRARLVSACSKGRPRLTSRMTRLNSVEMGGCVSRTTISMDCRNDEPARSELAMSVMVSARRPLNALRRLLLRRLSQNRGQPPADDRAPATYASGLPRLGTMVAPSRNTIAGMPSMAPAADGQELGGLEGQVRARQLARQVGAPVAAFSTTLLRSVSAREPASCSRQDLLPPCASPRSSRPRRPGGGVALQACPGPRRGACRTGPRR